MIPYTIPQADDTLYEDKGVGLCVLCAARAREWEVRIRDWVASEMSILNSKMHCNLSQPNVTIMRKCLVANALCMSGCTRGLGNVHLLPVKVIARTLWGQAFDPVFHDSVHVHARVESPPSLPSSIHPSPSAMLYFQSSPLTSIPHLPVMSYFPSFN
jgi:hypothetical protein